MRFSRGISTGHVREATARRLDATPFRQWPCLGGRYGEYGWLVYAHDENSGMGADAIPEVLFAVMSWSQKQGCDHVLFDRDGNIVDELPHFDW
jgi:hypothetical protein